MRRFLIPPSMLTDRTVTVDGDLYRHMARVLRLQPGDEVILCNGEGVDFHATVQEVSNRTLSLEITESHVNALDSRLTPSFTLIQGLTKGEKFDFIIQKSTELGINSIIAFTAAHSVTRIPPEKGESRVSRWGKIAAEASRQSERRSVPAVALAENLETALRDAKESVKLMLLEREPDTRLRDTLTGLSTPDSVAILAGPEGGFSAEEIKIAIHYGFTPVSLGTRILRAETASVAMLSILQYQWGDMG